MLFVKMAPSEDGGVILSKQNEDGSKMTSVYLSVEAWNLLARYQAAAVSAMETGTPGSWVLQTFHAESQLRLTVDLFGGRHLLSVRVYNSGKATRHGVSMTLPTFGYLQTFLSTGPEFELGRAVYKSLVFDQVWKKHAAACAGCELMRGSQRDHDCTTPPTNAAQLVRETGVGVCEFQLALARKCCERQIILAHPHTTYKVLHGSYRDEIEKEVVVEFDERQESPAARPDDDNDRSAGYGPMKMYRR